ncbi:calcium-binding protein [Pseudonocardiaceae bacterium YIM PH 21723]|nr:calcium-binding protein [Pseudonocardiaceae bacterium YIM PH 21723]
MSRKLARRFRSWDDDGNGIIEQIDFVRRARRLAVALGFVVGSPEHQVIHENFVRQWDALAGVADADKDGQVTEAEYLEAFAKLIAERPEAFDELYAPILRLTMRLADADADGELNEAEWLNWFTAYMGQQAEQAQRTFQLLDANGDGKVTADEVMAAVREFYLGDNPDADANLLLGPIS